MPIDLDSPRTDERPTIQQRSSWPRERVLTALVVIAFMAAAVLGFLWYSSATGDDIDLAYTREAVLADTRQVAVNLPSMDPQHVEEGLDRWAQSTTGPLHEDILANRDKAIQIIKAAKRKTESALVDAAVAELDVAAGTARVLVGLDVTITPEQGPPTVSRVRMQFEMTRTGDGWKASKFSPVGTPVTGPN